ncbi:MAG: protein-glutamate O-methyltransferase CheR [bacterium]
MIAPITEQESARLREYIERECGIRLDRGKEYLLESRLSHLVVEYGYSSFSELHSDATKSRNVQLRDRIIDAMTTHETFWFRDESAWRFLDEIVVPSLLDKIRGGERVRVWSAASSTGQEAYGFVILVLEAAAQNGIRINPDQFHVLGTDISQAVLFQAISGTYDVFSVGRGLPHDLQLKHFLVHGRMWEISNEIKAFVSFRKFNLQDSFYGIGGPFDLVMMRNVAIYFRDEFKVGLFEKTARILKTDGFLLLGSTESLRGYSQFYEIKEYKTCTYNVLKF